MPVPSPVGNVMISAAQAAGRSLARDFNEIERLQGSRKIPDEFVNKAHFRAEKIISEHLTKSRPGYGFVMTEHEDIKGTDKTHRFIVNGLDGTVNFLHGNPHFAISIALERAGKLLTGVVFDVIRNELFWAERERSAWIERQKLSVSSRKNLNVAVVATTTARQGIIEPVSQALWNELACITTVCAAVRRTGSTALDLAYVAAGRLDGFWATGINRTSVATGIVLVEEAGGFVTSNGGQSPYDRGNVLASNEFIFSELRQRLSKAQSMTER